MGLTGIDRGSEERRATSLTGALRILGAPTPEMKTRRSPALLRSGMPALPKVLSRKEFYANLVILV
jgi:hypothetical protein